MAKAGGSGGRNGGSGKSKVESATDYLKENYGGKVWQKGGKDRVYLDNESVINEFRTQAEKTYTSKLSNNEASFIRSELSSGGVFLDRASLSFYFPSTNGWREGQKTAMRAAIASIRKNSGL